MRLARRQLVLPTTVKVFYAKFLIGNVPLAVLNVLLGCREIPKQDFALHVLPPFAGWAGAQRGLSATDV
jgi:hypothetical protein